MDGNINNGTEPKSTPTRGNGAKEKGGKNTHAHTPLKLRQRESKETYCLLTTYLIKAKPNGIQNCTEETQARILRGLEKEKKKWEQPKGKKVGRKKALTRH